MPEFDASEQIRGDPFELVINGEAFSGWESMSLSRSIQQVAGTFIVKVSGARSYPIARGDEVEVRMLDELVMTGFVDVIEGRSSAENREIVIAGRDRTSDLVDCSATAEPGEWSGLTLAEQVERLADPFGIKVVDNTPLGLPVFDLFKLQPGETAWNAIERAARLRAVLAFPDELGRIVLERAGEVQAEGILLEDREIGNILRSSIRTSDADRYQVYTVQGQRAGNDDAWGDDVAAIIGTATDSAVGRFRPLLIQAEGQVTFENASDRAQWEATVRAARAFKVTVEAQGWRQTLRNAEAGPLWKLNQRVPIRIPTLQFEGELLLEGITFSRDGESGTLSQLVFVRPDAYTPQPVIPPSGVAEDFLTNPDEIDFEALGLSRD